MALRASYASIESNKIDSYSRPSVGTTKQMKVVGSVEPFNDASTDARARQSELDEKNPVCSSFYYGIEELN